MRSFVILIVAAAFCSAAYVSPALSQETEFGQNKVQYTTFDWSFIQSSHFDVYFTNGGEYLADFTADAAESAYVLISKSFRYQLNNRVSIVIYNSHNDFQQTNVVNSYLEEGIGGVTELFKNRMVLPFEGDYKKFRHVIHHELVHAVVNDMFYGGSIQSIITNNITLQLPLWFNEGLAEYEALKWETDSDMFLRDATIHEYLPPIERLGGYFAYRGGQSVWNYIATKYGDQKISEILTRIRGTRSVDQGFRAAIGLSIPELSDRWLKEQKVLYWPDIAKRQEPADFAKRLTDHTKDGSFYNTSPSISPQGDRIAFISNRDDYFDVFIMNAADGSIEKKLVNGQRTADFEELHLLTPGMAWSPDSKRLALATKTGEKDAIIIMDVNSGDEQKIELGLDGIFSVAWSPVADPGHNGTLAFVGTLNGRSDIYTYDIDTKQLKNLTEDVFSDADPAWSPDGKSIYFASDRGSNLDPKAVPADFKMQHYDFHQLDLYRIDVATQIITRVTDLPSSDETSPVATPDGKHLLFISDMNGINNIYMKDLDSNTIYPQTNSLSGVYQLSLSRDGSKLAFNSLNNAGFDLFLMHNPLDREGKPATLEPTGFIKRSLQTRRPDTLFAKKDSISFSNDVVIKTSKEDTSAQYSSEVKIDLRNYVFSDNFRDRPEQHTDSSKLRVTNNLDENGNYKVNKYKLNFSPDIVYGNAGYNTYYGVMGTTEMAFSDMLGNHQFYILTNLLFDLKNSDYALAYFYLPKRLDLGIQIFHSARFLLLSDPTGNSDTLYRFTNYGLTGIGLYPLDKFNRLDFSLSWYNIAKDNMDDSFAPSEQRTVIVPSVSYVHDNSLWGITAPANGNRYNITLMGSPKLGSQSLGFYSVLLDYRNYFRLWRNYAFVVRLAGGGSFGEDPQRFIIGGVDNWINREFSNNRIPIDKPEDFVFLTAGIPLRGYDYNARLGTKYGLMNLELRFPFAGYFSAGPLPVFFQSLGGVIFLDMGSTWTLGRDVKLFDRDADGVYMRDLLAGTGYGVRMVFLGFLLKLDVAWSFDLQQTSTPKYYFSVGEDI
ncbi:MAG TPA: biopolymer transporter Tol [Bacteroidota bacterium]|nr:biopolymer transporter Tol [Bacteroidota bacterium]